VKKGIEWLKEETSEILLTSKKDGTNYFYYRDLKEKIYNAIDQLDEPEVLSQEWVAEHEMPVSWMAKEQKVVRVEHLQNLLVPKQELPVIPKFVADYIDDRKEASFPLYQAIRIAREDSRFEHSHLREWLWTNKGQETFVRIEEEQKYYVDLGSAAYVAKWEGNGQVDIYTDGISGSDEYELHLTEREIKDYDKRFWPFAVNVKELEE
jgi:hypothetical protein